jgi:hypothetical protein
MVLVALALVAIIAMAALSIDVITLYLAREEAQRAADAAALAAARVISISGVTGDPGGFVTWESACSSATQAATAVATQSAVGGTVANPVVTYSSSSNGTSSGNCATVGGAFPVNPVVTVKIVRTSLPTFFSRIWGNTGNSISATATAEVLNPSASEAYTSSGSVTPVQPSCVKPWMVPNIDPGNPALCTGTDCLPFVSLADGSIQNPGIQPVIANKVIGETFNLFADCEPGASCTLVGTGPPPPQANVTTGTFVGGLPATPNLEYLPGMTSYPSVAVPSCSVSTGLVAEYEPAIAGCDQGTSYQCGVQSSVAVSPANAVDLTENPGGAAGDTATGVSCLINQSTAGSANTGQDTINTLSYPYLITAGTGNPNTALNGKIISVSNSIMSFPIYDSTTTDFSVNPTNVTIVGFLQVFVNYVDANGNLNVTVLNVAGCGNNAANRAVTGSSPVPIRLITPP